MGFWVDRLGTALLDASLSAFVFLGVLALLMVGTRQPARRCGLARAAIIGSLALLPLVAFAPGRPRVELLGSIRSLTFPLWTAWPPPPSGAVPHAGNAAAPFMSPPSSWAALRWVRSAGWWTPRTLVVVYLVGATCGLAYLALGWWCSAWLVGRADEPTDSSLAFYGTMPYTGWRRPRLRLSSRLRRPILLGALRPTIVIPPELEQPEASEQLRLSLSHELAHAEHGDTYWSVAGSLAQAVWFFVPWIWWIQRQMRLDQEFLADHQAAGDFADPGSYASSLVTLADTGPGPAPEKQSEPDPVDEPPPRPRLRFMTFLGVGSALFQRVLMLIRCPYPVEARAPRWWRWSLPPLVAFGAFAASSLTLRSAEAPAASACGGCADAGHCAGTCSGSHRGFQLTRLVVAEAPAGPDGLTSPHNLPLALPDQFELTLEVWAEQAELAQTRVAGCRLGALGPGPADSTSKPQWHKVKIVRSASGLQVAVDGQVVAAPLPGNPGAWLSVQPAPQQVGLFRNMSIIW